MVLVSVLVRNATSAILILRSTGIELRFQLKALNQEVYQVIPTGKDHITHEGLDIIEKRLTPGEPWAEQGIRVIAPCQYRREQKGQEMETEPHRREVLLARPKVVRQMVALGLEHGVLVVCDLPAPPTRWRHMDNVVRRQAMMADTAIVRALCARGGMDHRDVAPIDRQGLVTPSQQYVVEVAHQRHFRDATIPAASFTLGHTAGGLPKRQALRARGMGVGLARKDAVATVVESQRTQGLVAGESIAQEGDAMGGPPRRMCGEPACARRPFTVLFGRPVLRHDGLGGQGDALRLTGADDHRGDGGVIIEGGAIGELAGETMVTMNGLGRQGVGTIQGHQAWVVKVANMGQHAVLCKALTAIQTHRSESARRERVEQLAALMITGNLLPTQQGVDVIWTLGLLQGALVVHKRRRLGKEDTKGAASGIVDTVWGVGPFFAMVRPRIDVSVQETLEVIEAYGMRPRHLLGLRGHHLHQ
jgi:hypothetical protein